MALPQLLRRGMVLLSRAPVGCLAAQAARPPVQLCLRPLSALCRPAVSRPGPWASARGPGRGVLAGGTPGPAARALGLLGWRSAHSQAPEPSKKKDADEVIKTYLLRATALTAGIGTACVLVPAMAMVAAGGLLVGLGGMAIVMLRYRRELATLRTIYNEHKKVMENMNTLGVRDVDVRRQQQLQDQLGQVFPPGHGGFGLPALLDAAFQASGKTFQSAQEVVREVQDLAVMAISKDGNTKRIIGENAVGQSCTEIEHHTVDGFTSVKIAFPVSGNMGSGRAFVKAEKDEEGTVLKSIKVIENRTGRPYRVYVKPRPQRVIDAEFQDT